MNSEQNFISFTLIHIDVWGPSPTLNILGARWFLNFMYDWS